MGSFTLLNPWLLVGLVGASLPVLIHLIGRKRAPQVRFAAFDFLMAVNKRLARRERLRQLLLLLLRSLAIAALVIAVARPMPPQPAHAAVAPSRYVALVVDTSGSMAYRKGASTLLELAKKKARDVLSRLQPGDEVSLVLAGPTVRAPLQTPTIDRATLRRAIDGIDRAEGVADLGTAIDTALAQLGKDAAGATVVVVSDLAENSFEQLRPTALEPPPRVRLIDVAERQSPEALPNLAVERVTVRRSGAAASERTIHVLVRNYGSAAVSKAPLELLVNGTVTHRAYVDVPARGSSEKTLTYDFTSPGVYDGRIRLQPTDDGYAVDDAYDFVTSINRGVRVLAVDGDPRTVPYEDELFFVERALSTIPKGEPPIAVRIVTRDEMASGSVDLTGFDVVLLANVGSLPPAQVARLRDFVQHGGGLLFGLGDKVHFEQANKSFGDLLPRPLRDLHRAADPDAGTPPLGIGDLDWDHPILRGLGSAVEQSLRASHTTSYFNLDVGSGRAARAVLRFDNGAPALVEGRREKGGRVMLLTTSLDVDMTDLPLRSAFPALLQRCVRYLAHAEDTVHAGAVRVGDAIDLPLPTGDRGVALTGPDGKRHVADATAAASHRAHFAGFDTPGIYRAEVLRAKWEKAPRLDVAVNPSLAESDFMPVRAQRVADVLGGGSGGHSVSVSVAATPGANPFETRGYAPFLLVALGLLFVSESLLAARG